MAQTTKALDDRWFAKLMELIQQNNDWEKLNKSLQINQTERERFFEDEVENPRFRYFYNQHSIQNRDAYYELKEIIAATETNQYVRDLYLQKLDAQVARVAMMEASAAGNDEEFLNHSIDVYGKPKKHYFSYLAKRIVELCETHDQTWKTAAAKRLLPIFLKVDRSKTTITQDFLPEPVFEKQEIIDGQMAQEIFSATLDSYGITGWHVIVDTTETRRVFSVVPSRKEIYIPSDANLINRPEPLTRLKAEAVAEHEIGVHVRRAHEGAQQPLRLLSVGLHSYLRGEEGLASYVQQQIEGTQEFYGFERYLAASLAYGMDGTVRDFRSVYATMLDYFILTARHKSALEESVKRAAWDVTVRIFRGTSATSPGCIYTRDLAYLEGNVCIWKLLIDKPHIFPHLFIGKFDPVSSQHVEALQKLEILPEW